MSLRARLLAGLMALVAVGLAAFGVGTYVALRSFLLRRLDQQLIAAARPVSRLVTPGPAVTPGGVDPKTVSDAAGPGVYVEVRDAQGAVVAAVPAGPPGSPDGGPRLPAILDVPSPVPPLPGPGGRPPSAGYRAFTVPANAGGGRYRVVARALPAAQGVVIVSAPLAPLNQTLGHLVEVEVAMGAAVLAASAVLGVALARQAARPLEHIATTADAITAGDLSRRVQGAAAASEVGRVASALNAMLGEIQDSFARRDATEARLRRFVADASHELSTPLTSIQGYAELLEIGPSLDPADLATAMGRIHSEAARMARLVDDLLLLAAMDRGRPLRGEPVDLSLVATDAATDIRAAQPRRPVACEAAGRVVVYGDEDRLRQVAANLCANARRHTPAGTPVTVRAGAAGAFGVLEVADHGPGLTAEQSARVFDRFYRVDTARARSQGGSGLGLAIVAAVVEAHRGRVSVSTTPGGGATFRVEIPLAAPPALPAACSPADPG